MAKCKICNGCIDPISPIKKTEDGREKDYHCDFCKIEWTYNFSKSKFRRKVENENNSA